MDALDHRDDLAAVDEDFVHLFSSWFNRGFLVLRHIDWSTPAIVLEKIIRYEAVHEISDWEDLRRRIDPPDRRCYAFFHPALVDEPLIFVEVALSPRHSGRDRADPCHRARGGGARQDAHRGVLFDLQLPARACRRVVRQFPDQAGGRGDQPRNAEARDFRDAVAGDEFRRLAQARTRACESSTALERGRQGAVGRARRSGLVAQPGDSGASAGSADARGRLVFPARAQRARAAGRRGGALPSRQRRAARAHQLARPTPRTRRWRRRTG